MNISERGLELIRSHEGCRLEAYQDSVGIWTIGYGHTGSLVVKGLTITQDEANELLKHDVRVAEGIITALVAVPLTQSEFDALCSFTFNLGGTALRNSALLRKLNASDYDGASLEFLKWDHAGGKQLSGLTRRRADERELFEA